MAAEAGARQAGAISIHAPRGGSDWGAAPDGGDGGDFNPRSPWGERLLRTRTRLRFILFQSTLPVGGATFLKKRKKRRNNISIHAPRGGSDKQYRARGRRAGNFNPRSPWGERPTIVDGVMEQMQFQSTLPVGGATRNRDILRRNGKISIHAPRGGSDQGLTEQKPALSYFNPRSPWGERRKRYGATYQIEIFQSTLPVGGATQDADAVMFIWRISIHAPRGGSDECFR